MEKFGLDFHSILIKEIIMDGSLDILTIQPNGFTLTNAFCDTPHTIAGGIWQAGKGLASDGTYIYCAVGNGNFDPANNEWGMAFLKLNQSLAVVDYFCTSNELGYSNSDSDTGNIGPVLIPGTLLMFGGGTKYGKGHVIDSQNMGGWNSTVDTCLQTIAMGTSRVGQNAIASEGSAGTFVYTYGAPANLSQWNVNGNSGFSPTTAYKTYAINTGGQLCVSSNGSNDGILWVIDEAAILYAFDATDVSLGPLYSSNTNGGDSLGSVGHWQFPVVANGKAYIPTGLQSIAVYGLLSTNAPTQLAFVQEPQNVEVNTPMSQIQVAIQDANGITVSNATNTITLALVNGGSATLQGTTSVAAAVGVASFTSLKITGAGTFTLTASATGFPSVTSSSFTVTLPAASSHESSGASVVSLSLILLAILSILI